MGRVLDFARAPQAKVYAYGECKGDEWTAFINAMRSGEPVEVDEEMAYYWLEVLPPVYMGRMVEIAGESLRAWFGFAEGEEKIVAFFRGGTRYFCCQTEQVNRGS